MLGKIIMEFGASFDNLTPATTVFDNVEKEIGKRCGVMGAKNNVNMTELLLQLVPITLSNASTNGNITLGKTRAFPERIILYAPFFRRFL